jgi:hypothetical protein
MTPPVIVLAAEGILGAAAPLLRVAGAPVCPLA